MAPERILGNDYDERSEVSKRPQGLALIRCFSCLTLLSSLSFVMPPIDLEPWHDLGGAGDRIFPVPLFRVNCTSLSPFMTTAAKPKHCTLSHSPFFLCYSVVELMHRVIHEPAPTLPPSHHPLLSDFVNVYVLFVARERRATQRFGSDSQRPPPPPLSSLAACKNSPRIDRLQRRFSTITSLLRSTREGRTS